MVSYHSPYNCRNDDALSCVEPKNFCAKCYVLQHFRSCDIINKMICLGRGDSGSENRVFGTGRPSPTLVACCRATSNRHFDSVGIMVINSGRLKSLEKRESICRLVCHDSAWLCDLIKKSISPEFGSKLLRLVAPAELFFTDLPFRAAVHSSSS